MFQNTNGIGSKICALYRVSKALYLKPVILHWPISRQIRNSTYTKLCLLTTNRVMLGLWHSTVLWITSGQLSATVVPDLLHSSEKQWLILFVRLHGQLWTFAGNILTTESYSFILCKIETIHFSDELLVRAKKPRPSIIAAVFFVEKCHLPCGFLLCCDEI